MRIRAIESGKGAVCARIMPELPEWFAFPDVNANLAREVELYPMWVAEEDGEAVGFLALKPHTPAAAEISVIGVLATRHRRGVGRSLVAAAEAYCRDQRFEFLTLKTLAPSHANDGYARTHKFYEALGFRPVEVFKTFWNEDNPCLLMIKPLGR